ncbi:MAG: hypothetical protein ABI606_18420 [Rhodoferax sp.]
MKSPKFIPDPGAFMRRLDDGTNIADKKPGIKEQMDKLPVKY